MRSIKRSRLRRGIGLLIALAVLVSIIAVYFISMSPRSQLKDSTTRVAEKQGVSALDNFRWDTQRESYLSLEGKKGGRAVYVLVRQKTGDVTILNRSDGITAAQASRQAYDDFDARNVFTVGLSKRGKNFVWDVGYRLKSGKLGYVTYDFNTGEQIFSVSNL